METAPRATSTAPPLGIGVDPAVVTCVTVPSSGWLRCAGGNDPSTASTTAPDSFGVVAPYAGVKSVNLPVGTLSSSGRRWPFPCQIPAEET